MGVAYAPRAEDVDLLRAAGMAEADLEHSLRVAEKALELARRTGAAVDMEWIGRGALFHDLGKARTHAIEHGRVGAEMGRSLGLPEPVTALMEKHIRGGLGADEAAALGLPARDYTPRALEERIVIYADRLVDIIWDGIVELASEREAEARFVEVLENHQQYGKNPQTRARYLAYHAEIQGLMATKEARP